MNTIDFEKVTLEELKQKQIEMLGFDPEDYYVCLRLIRQNGCNLQYVKEQTPEICLEAVKENGTALRFVKEQTPEICLEAVKQDGTALQFVKEQTSEICLEAVKQYGSSLRYVKEQTTEICLEAVKQDKRALMYVKDLSMLKQMKVFISVGMSGRLKDDVIKDLSLARGDIISRFGTNVLIIDNYSCVAPECAGRLYYLGEAIKKLDGVDAVYFCKGWENHKGCVIEREICKIYNIQIIDEED